MAFVLEALDRFKKNTRTFLLTHKAFFLGICVFCASILPHFFSCLTLFTWLVFLLLFLLEKKRSYLLFTAGLSLLAFFISTSTLPCGDREGFYSGRGIFIADRVASHPTFYNKGYVLKGTLKVFETKHSVIKNLPCSVYFDSLNFEINDTYNVEGVIEITKQGYAKIKEKQLFAKKERFSFVKKRWELQKRCSAYIETCSPDHKVATLFIALLCGQIEEKILSLEFSKLGLSHLLAISGFHFSLVAGVIGQFFLKVFPRRLAVLTISLLLLFYAFFIGFTPSVNRAVIMAILPLLTPFFAFKHHPLNAFGIALIIGSFISQNGVLSPGFLLTYLSSFAILFFHPLTSSFLEAVFPKREKSSDFLLESFLQKLSSFLRESLSINLAIFLIAYLPTSALFGSFPLSSLVYNLFIPFGIGLVLKYAFVLFLVTPLCPPLFLWGHKAASLCALFFLKIIEHPPAFLSLDIASSLPWQIGVMGLYFLFFLKMTLPQKEELLLPSCFY